MPTNPSITYWSRLEPRPRSRSIARSLAARVHDPLWMLARQWQIGEFRGEDAASPAYVQLSTSVSSLSGWRPRGQTTRRLEDGAPLQKLVTGEPLVPDPLLRVEMGQALETLLIQANAADAIEELRDGYPIKPLPESELARMEDRDLARFLRVCAGRAIDGVAVYAGAQGLLASVTGQNVRTALEQFVEWVREIFGEPDTREPPREPPAWEQERLEYDAEVTATLPNGNGAVLSAHPDTDGSFDWHGLDLRQQTGGGGGVSSSRQTVLPTNVRFRGMPNARWWEFEHGRTDFGEVKPDRRDVARLVVVDFLLVHGNDWFVVPLALPVNSLCRVDSLLVHDVFGGVTVVDRTDAAPPGLPVHRGLLANLAATTRRLLRIPAPPRKRWTMFSTSVEGSAPDTADFFILPPSASVATQVGPDLEEVRFVRDEMANAAWAIEHVTENGIGEPRPGHERAFAGGGTSSPAGDQEGKGEPSLRYRIQTTVPEHWIPLLPVLVDEGRAEIALERGAMLRPATGEASRAVQPVGRILRPGEQDYRVREEEVPRTGIRVLRTVYRTRWIDGSTHVWIARRKLPGAGEGSSGLRFDTVCDE